MSTALRIPMAPRLDSAYCTHVCVAARVRFPISGQPRIAPATIREITRNTAATGLAAVFPNEAWPAPSYHPDLSRIPPPLRFE